VREIFDAAEEVWRLDHERCCLIVDCLRERCAGLARLRVKLHELEIDPAC
jgi:hypothetical protein